MQSELFNQLTGVIGETLGVDATTLTPSTTAEDVDNWDSLNHLRVITAVEKHFSVRLSMAEILEMENVGDLAAAVESKTATA